MISRSFSPPLPPMLRKSNIAPSSLGFLFGRAGNSFEVFRLACALRWRTISSTSSSDTNGPWTRLIRPPLAMYCMSPWLAVVASAHFCRVMVRLSIFDVTWKEIRVGKFALMVPVMTSTDATRCVARITWCSRRGPFARRVARHLLTALRLATICWPAISSTMMTMEGQRLGAWRFSSCRWPCRFFCRKRRAPKGPVFSPFALASAIRGIVAIDVAHTEFGHVLV